MNDALLSFSSATEAIKLVQQIQEMMAFLNLWLHKVPSNNIDIIIFSAEDKAKDIKDVDLFAGLHPWCHLEHYVYQGVPRQLPNTVFHPL